MAGFSVCVIFTSVLCQLTATAASGTLKEVVGALGGSVTFTVNITEKEVDQIIWTFKTLFLAIKTKDKVIMSENERKRIVIPDGSYSMTLRQLRKNDSGVYRVEIHIPSLQSPFTQEYQLHVYEYLSKPSITMDGQDNKNGTCRINLTCSTEQGGENVTYSWRTVGQAVDEFHDGANLPISWSLGEKDKTLICVARNPISNSSSVPTLARNHCKDATKDQNLPKVFICVMPVSILLIVFPGIIFIAMRRMKENGCGEDTKRVDSHQENPNFCPHTEENTDYATIPYISKTNPEEDASNTFYSTVQIPKAVKSPGSLPATPHMPKTLRFENVI
ncbi:SLAM family member 7 isoform X2 [Psammomys obesus]|uniref:SLAM family member 7 isoform X2 n=1 Tax=Psammomys obesus TaxID=48139 RepID=UPI002452E91C|nr:SLAM family member 7 isoform X2 [Psammomys obesus]